MIETLENTIKDKKELDEAKKQLDDIVAIVVDDCANVLDKYDEKIEAIETKNRNYENRIEALEEKIKYFEKMIELEDYDFFITCPYCGFEFQHVKPGKGAAFVRTKLKNVINGSVLEKTFNPSEKLQGAEIEKRDMQYLYNDEDLYYFMDNETYEQMPLNKEQIGDALKFIKENMNCKILSFKGNVFAVEPPMFVELEVTYTEPGFSGNTTTTSGKPATLENGYEISVPLFVNIGDVIRIDTRTGEYMERI